MVARTFASLAALALAACVMPAQAAANGFWQCVTYARAVSGIEIRGNAHTWWHQAEGRYERGREPREGAVMAMPGHGKMRLGHVAMVSRVINDREVLLDHANWSRRGMPERNVRAIDVSEKGDWSRVKIWYARNGDVGTTAYPVHGFIYPEASRGRIEMASVAAPAAKRRGALLSDEIAQLAALESRGSTGGF